MNSLILAAAMLVGAPPETPTAPIKVSVGDDHIVEIKSEKPAAFREGFRLADCLAVRLYTSDPNRILMLVRPKRPGYYVIVFWTVGESASSLLEIDATKDTPEPPPAPPTVGPFELIIVEESEQAAQSRATLFADRGLVDFVKEKKSKIYVIDRDVKNPEGQSPPKFAKYIERTGKYPSYYLLVNGQEVASGFLSVTTADDLKTIIQRYVK